MNPKLDGITLFLCSFVPRRNISVRYSLLASGVLEQPTQCPEAVNQQETTKLVALKPSAEGASILVLLHFWADIGIYTCWRLLSPEASEVAGLAERPFPEGTEGSLALYNEVLTISLRRGLPSEAWRPWRQDLFPTAFLAIMTVLRSVLPLEGCSLEGLPDPPSVWGKLR